MAVRNAERDVLRRQLTAYSPIAFSGLLRAAFAPDAETEARFDALIRSRYPCDAVLGFDSGTSALTAAIELACDVAQTRTVAIPAYGCFDLATAVVGAGVQYVAYDIDPVTLGPDFASLESALARARVAIIAPLYGVPVDWSAVEALTARHDAIAIEDAAQGHGATWNGVRLGALGPCSVLSFGRGKGWTGGGGGALLLRDARLVAAAERKTIAHSGRTTDLGVLARAGAQWLLGRPSLYGLPARIPALGLGETRYRAPGRMTVLPRAAAALIVDSVRRADEEAAVRRRNAALYAEAFASVAGMETAGPPDGAEPGWLRFPVRVAAPSRAAWRRSTATERGVGAAYPIPLPGLPALRSHFATGGAGPWPGADGLVASLVTLPTHSRVTGADRTRIMELLARGGARTDARRAEAGVEERAGIRR